MGLLEASVAAEPPGPVAQILWDFSVSARDVFALCRILRTCGQVEVQRCTAVVRQGKARIRVDIILPADQMDVVLHQAISGVNDAEIGRIRLVDSA
jgi:hypothetical protein